MTLKQFYENIHGSYDDIYERLPSQSSILRFVNRFPSDRTYAELMTAVQNDDVSASFEATHKLKGIAANLAFTQLFDALTELCEQLRPQCETADPTLVNLVRISYLSILNEIEKLEEIV